MTKILLVFGVFVVFLSPFFLFIKFVKGKVRKQKGSSWKGNLVDKKHLEYEDDDSAYTKDLYTLVFETVEGKQEKMNVPKEIYDDWEIGNKAEKVVGSLYPDKTV